jgi:hypothetical protein
MPPADQLVDWGHSSIRPTPVARRLNPRPHSLHEHRMTGRFKRRNPLHENLDTAYLNLAALLDYLAARDFNGLILIHLDEYEGEVILRAGEKPSARERGDVTGEESQVSEESHEGEAALRRLLVRAREPGGLVTVYECTPEEAAEELASWAQAEGSEEASSSTAGDAGQGEMIEMAGELAAAVERAVVVAGGEFEAALHGARLSLAEDFPFLNPFARKFAYAEGAVRLDAQAGEQLFVSGLCEMLRRVVEHVAVAEQKIGVRKDAARELSILLRRRRSRLERFRITARQLERIAGMKLL